jgi:hypothetical protein
MSGKDRDAVGSASASVSRRLGPDSRHGVVAGLDPTGHRGTPERAAVPERSGGPVGVGRATRRARPHHCEAMRLRGQSNRAIGQSCAPASGYSTCPATWGLRPSRGSRRCPHPGWRGPCRGGARERPRHQEGDAGRVGHLQEATTVGRSAHVTRPRASHAASSSASPSRVRRRLPRACGSSRSGPRRALDPAAHRLLWAGGTRWCRRHPSPGRAEAACARARPASRPPPDATGPGQTCCGTPGMKTGRDGRLRVPEVRGADGGPGGNRAASATLKVLAGLERAAARGPPTAAEQAA